MAQKKKLFVISRPLQKLFRELRDMPLEEVDGWGKFLSPVQPEDHVIGRVDPFLQKVLSLQIKRTDALNELPGDSDPAIAFGFLEDIDFLESLGLFLTRKTPLPKEFQYKNIKWYVRKNFILVCQESAETNGHHVGLEHEDLESYSDTDAYDEDGEEEEDDPFSTPQKNIKKLN